MKVLIACEYSGVVRTAFAKLGHSAISCDLEPTEIPGPHYQCDVREVLNDWWDLVIAHPPCTHIAVSGAAHFAEKIADGRQQAGIEFFMLFTKLDRVPAVCIENPVCIMSRLWRKPDQIIQPWQFGHPESKTTCLWLKGLPKLKPTNLLSKPARGYWDNQTPSGQNKLGPSLKRAALRSKTYQGIADAMAEQYTKYLEAVA